MIPIRALLSTIALLGIATSIGAIANPGSLPIQDYKPMRYEETSGKVEGVTLRDGSKAPPCGSGENLCIIVVEGSEYSKHQDLLDGLKAESGKKCNYFSGFNSESRFCIIGKPDQIIPFHAKLSEAGVKYKVNGGINSLKVGGG